ncbi:MAG: NAD(P)/FAD-dependent oxidoreductase [Cellvibrionales bacterium]|nr:NAD(P)/FAD-dependent oxidoreductase [Cellvibrionales bacterium]
MNSSNQKEKNIDYEFIIIGAGISGIGAGIELRKNNMNSFLILERGEDLGGTWRDNIYPGIACDIPSIAYSFSFELNPNWSSMNPPGSEILEYIRHCATKYNISQHIKYSKNVDSIQFDAKDNTWITTLKDGTEYISRFVISATGVFGDPKYPNIEGLDSFNGKIMHTARWDKNYDIKNKRVAIIGTGASSVQVVPSICHDVSHLTVFQRTPSWVIPRSHIEFTPKIRRAFNKFPFLQKISRSFLELLMELSTLYSVNHQRLKMPSFSTEGGIQKKQEQSSRLKRHIARQVDNPEDVEKLTPNYGLGCKRPTFSDQYLKAFNQKNVSLVTSPIKSITQDGVMCDDGEEHKIDLLILSTGFVTQEPGSSPSFSVHGLNGKELGTFWDKNRFQAFNGVSVPDFPNFFLTSGPYSGGYNWFTMLDTHVKYIIRCVKEVKKRNATYIEVKSISNDKYFELMQKKSSHSVFQSENCIKSNSYYRDKHGDFSLPAPFTPMWRSLRLKFGSLDSFYFKT